MMQAATSESQEEPSSTDDNEYTVSEEETAPE
jgi:hypothetical protein